MHQNQPVYVSKISINRIKIPDSLKIGYQQAELQMVYCP